MICEACDKNFEKENCPYIIYKCKHFFCLECLKELNFTEEPLFLKDVCGFCKLIDWYRATGQMKKLLQSKHFIPKHIWFDFFVNRDFNDPDLDWSIDNNF